MFSQCFPNVFPSAPATGASPQAALPADHQAQADPETSITSMAWNGRYLCAGLAGEEFLDGKLPDFFFQGSFGENFHEYFFMVEQLKLFFVGRKFETTSGFIVSWKNMGTQPRIVEEYLFLERIMMIFMGFHNSG